MSETVEGGIVDLNSQELERVSRSLRREYENTTSEVDRDTLTKCLRLRINSGKWGRFWCDHEFSMFYTLPDLPYLDRSHILERKYCPLCGKIKETVQLKRRN